MNLNFRLETRDGGLVSEKTVPMFKMLPEVVVWGSRTFAISLDQSIRPGSVIVYREVFSYAIVDIETAGEGAGAR